MPRPIQLEEQPAFGHWLVRKWRGWQRRCGTAAEIDCRDRDDAEPPARDVAMPRAEFCILAGKWPDNDSKTT